MKVYDDQVPPELRKSILGILRKVDWKYGWKSNIERDKFSFFHAHLGGSIKPDHSGSAQYNCLDEIKHQALRDLWEIIDKIVPNQVLVRCYANGFPYGCDGTVHTDSVNPKSLTWIYYPHETWDPNWAGETVFFNKDEIINAIYPKPGRLLVFNGTVPHVGRGIARECPVMRITLMYKTELRDESRP